MPDLLIRQAIISEQKELEGLQLRASPPMPAIVRPYWPIPMLSNCPSIKSQRARYLLRSAAERLSDSQPWNQEQTETANLMHCSSPPICDVAGLRDR